MNELMTELQRLYFLRGQTWASREADDGGEAPWKPEGVLTEPILAACLAGEKTVALDLVGADGRVRAMVLSFERSGHWDEVAQVCLGVQNDLDLPAPAVSVSGDTGYGLWFSLAEAVPLVEAQAFLDGLRRKYLAELPGECFELRPQAGKPAASVQSRVNLCPSMHRASGKWSAFIDPSLGSMFSDEPWLDIAPNQDKQADILAGLESIKPGDFQAALGMLRGADSPVAPAVNPLAGAAPLVDQPGPGVGMNEHYTDPESFLLAVMNDASVSAAVRVEAAKALLPYYRRKIGEA